MTPQYLKRVYKEIEKFNNKINFNKYNKNIQDFFNNLNIIEYLLENDNTYLDIKDNNNLLLTIKVPKKYPFTCYEIVFNNKTNKFNNKNSYLKNIGLLSENKIYDEKILAFFYKLQYGIESKFLNLKNNECFCCNSIFCSYNWNPSLTIENILLEYLEIQFILKYSRPYNYINILNIYNKLNDKYLNKLPIELQDKIFYNLYE
jgi:ubiquitin-protein ligase